MQIERRAGETALSFPDFEDGPHLRQLVEAIATALQTRPRVPRLSVDLFVGFEGYPEQFELWWDGMTCELACAEPCGVDMEAVVNRLATSSLFTLEEG